jgi:leucyl aminopeptidase
MDKHGAASVLSAFETVIDLGLPINITSSMGYV